MTESQATALGAGLGAVGGTLGGPIGTVVGGAAGGAIGKKLYNLGSAEKDAMDALKGVDYADYNQAYYEELQKRATMGMPEEQKQYAEMQADRAAGLGLQATTDQRGGLLGVRQAQMGLSDAYRNIAQIDASYKLQNQMNLLGEMNTRGNMAYKEGNEAGQMDLALAGRNRQEFISLLNSGMQTGANIAGMAPMMFGMPPVPLGGAAPQVQAGGSIAPPQSTINYQPKTGGFNSYSQPSGFNAYSQQPLGRFNQYTQ